MNLEQLSELKDKLMTADDLRDPWNYFFDHFGENPEFIGLGKRIKSPLLKVILAKIGKEVFGDGARITGLMLKKVKTHNFVHGTCDIQGHLAVLIFFKDVDMGMVSIVGSPRAAGETLLIRFSSYEMKSDADLGETTVVLPPTGRGVN